MSNVLSKSALFREMPATFTREQLVVSAAAIKTPDPTSRVEYSVRRDQLADLVTAAMSGHPDIDRLVGKDNMELMGSNHRRYAIFAETLWASFDPQVLVRTVIGMYAGSRAAGFSSAYWPAQFESWLQVLSDQLTPAAFAAISPYFLWLKANHYSFVALTDSLQS
jgi:hypothetical protein